MSSLPQTQRREPPVIANVTNLLAANMKAIQSCLPKHMTPERMCRVALQDHPAHTAAHELHPGKPCGGHRRGIKPRP